MQHKISSYRDGFQDVQYCMVCSREGADLNNECPGKYVPNENTLNVGKSEPKNITE